MTHRVLAAALLLAALNARGDDPPTDSDVKRAYEILAVGAQDVVPEALDILARDGSRAALEAVGEFGARTPYPKMTVIAGQALATRQPDEAAKLLKKLARTHKKTPRNLARVAVMAEQIEGARGRDLLLDFAKDRREIVAATAVRALGARGEDDARSVLLSLLKSPRTIVAGAAAYALSYLPPEAGTMEELFKRAQRGTDDRVGDACALALARMEGAEAYGDRALSLLIKRSSNESFHGLAKLVLRVAKNPDPALLDQALLSPADEVREVACDLIGLRRLDGFGRKLLKLATSDRNWRNNVSAWLALRRAGAGDALDGVAGQIGGRGEPSYWAIQCVSADPPEAVHEALIEAALDTKDPVRRELAQRALRNATRAGEKIRAHYLETVRARRGTDRAEAALLGLGNLKEKESFLALLALLEQEQEPRYRLWIVRGLEKLTGHFFEPDPEIWKAWYEVVDGQVAYDPKPVDRKANRERVRKIRDLGISAETERAVENGLLWLTRHQDLDGGWNGATYHEHCEPDRECAKEGGIRDRPLAYTGLALLAFQGAGYSHLDGPYRDAVQRGFEYILRHQDYDGSHSEKGWTFSYEAAIVCQALCDGYALTGDEWLGQGAQRMLDYLVKIQYPGRTWRYRVRSSETDTSVMSWILTACIAARHAGLDIPEQIMVASEVWLDTAADPVPPGEFELFVPDRFRDDNPYFIDVSRGRDGKIREFKIKTWYQPPRLYTPAMSAIGVLVRIWLGWTRAHPFCIGGANQVISQIPGYGTGLEGEFAFYPYTWYYGSLAMYQMGGRFWQRWRDGCITDIIKNQHRGGCQLGSWEMPRGQFVSGLTGGTVYCTAMAILTLETFYRYQPYLDRHDLRSKEENQPESKHEAPPK